MVRLETEIRKAQANIFFVYRKSLRHDVEGGVINQTK